MKSATQRRPSGLWISGTDTGVGKTFVAAGICRVLSAAGVRVGAYKPVATGCDTLPDGRLRSRDAGELWEAIAGNGSEDHVCPQLFAVEAAPPVAAAQEGRRVDRALLRSGAAWWFDRCEMLLIEGVGGLLCPLTEDETVADLVADLPYPLIIVARRGLGTINHALMTVEVARVRGLKVAGVILNGSEPSRDTLAERTNAEELRKRLDCPLLAVLPHVAAASHVTATANGMPVSPAPATPASSALSILSTMDWRGLARDR